MRKIKLMALLLAALMIVSAFAGCAGVKKEELDALDVRVQALEDLLNGQQKSLEEIKNDLKAGDDYSEVLDAIESIKTDLEDKIKDVNGRIDTEVGKVDTPTASVSDETKAAQQKALALIEVRRAEFNKAAGDYAEDDYVKISEALGTATGAVNAATTVDAVNAAMAALDAELDKYMSYAMKAYDYYTQLLGGITADAEELVDEAKDFLKTVKAVYDAGEVEFEGKLNNSSVTKVEEYVAELAYLVSEGNTAARDSYIDVYNAIADLCTLFSAKTGTKEIPYEDDGKVKTEMLDTLAAYTKRADSIVEEIEDTIGENLIYDEASTSAYQTFKSVYAKYEQYVEDVALLGGDALVALITNADALVAAEDTYKLIEEAVAAYTEATRVGAGNYQDVFYYYVELTRANHQNKLEWEKTTKDIIWTADYYEKVDETLNAWKTEYELSYENVKAIIANVEVDTNRDGKIDSSDRAINYSQYVADKHLNDLLVAAVNEFKTEIAPMILDLNEADSASIDMVLAYDEIEELFADFVVLQEAATDKKIEAPFKDEITFGDLGYTSNDIDGDGVEDGAENLKVIVREADLFDDYADERLNTAFTGKTVANFLATNGLIDLFTFEADIDYIEDMEVVVDTANKEKHVYYYYENANDDSSIAPYTKTETVGTDTWTVHYYEDGRAQGEIYGFLTDTYEAIKVVAKAINDKIEQYADEIEAFSADSNMNLVLLSGEYKILASAETYTSGTLNVNAANSLANSWYVDIDAIDWNKSGMTNNEALDDYLDGLNETDKSSGSYKMKAGTVLSIRAFENKHPEFIEMINLDEYNEAVATMETRMTSLFDLAEQIVEDVEAIDYVRTGSTTKYYVDENENSKFDASVDTLLTSYNPTYLVSLEDKADVDVAFATYTKWSEEGGTLKQSKIANYVDSKDVVYDDVYFEDKLSDTVQREVKAASAKVHELTEDIEALTKLAKKFINTVTAIKAIDAGNPIVVDTSTNHLGAVPALDANNASSVRKYYAWSKFTARGSDYHSFDGTYSVVLSSTDNGVWTTSKSTDGKVDSTADEMIGKISGFAKTKAEVVGWAITHYDNFYNAHVEYIPDAANNYKDSNDDYYQVSDYVAYDAFDKAVADFEQYNILNVKGYIFGLLTDSNNIYQKKLKDLVDSATTLAKIENHVKTYVDDGNLGVTITKAGLDVVSIYEFERLS